jgi:hypothetical protein
LLRPINTISDLLDYARHHNGEVPRDVLEASGLGSMGAVAAELMRIGHRVKTRPDRIILEQDAAEGAALRAKDQISIFDMAPTPAPHHGWGDDPE